MAATDPVYYVDQPYCIASTGLYKWYVVYNVLVSVVDVGVS